MVASMILDRKAAEVSDGSAQAGCSPVEAASSPSVQVKVAMMHISTLAR
jgi:hypothetical protein